MVALFEMVQVPGNELNASVLMSQGTSGVAEPPPAPEDAELLAEDELLLAEDELLLLAEDEVLLAEDAVLLADELLLEEDEAVVLEVVVADPPAPPLEDVEPAALVLGPVVGPAPVVDAAPPVPWLNGPKSKLQPASEMRKIPGMSRMGCMIARGARVLAVDFFGILFQMRAGGGP